MTDTLWLTMAQLFQGLAGWGHLKPRPKGRADV
jgi:hypothetical protein